MANIEYESRQDRYDAYLEGHLNVNPGSIGTSEKVKLLRNYREKKFEDFRSAIYAKRGWSPNGVPTVETLKRFQIDFPETIELVKNRY